MPNHSQYPLTEDLDISGKPIVLMAERVVDKACECNRVTDDLHQANRGVPNENGGDDKKYIFQDSREGDDQAGGSSDLDRLSAGGRGQKL